MDEMIDACVMGLNSIGRGFCTYAAAMFFQTGMLVAILFLLDLLLRRYVRATLRYWIWLLVFVKLLLPPSLCAPTGIGYWCGKYTPSSPWVAPQPAETAVSAPVRTEPAARIETPESRPWAAYTTPAVVEAGESAVPHGERLSWQGGVFVLWAAGVFVFGVLLMQRLLFVRGLIAQGEPAGDDLVDVLGRCRRRVGVRREVGLLLSPNAFSPAVCGFFRPVILMPARLLEKLPAHSAEAILIHELAHLKRGDIWVNCAQTVLQIIYFYNPLVWLANAMVRRVREQAVDEMVLVALGAEAKSYGRALIDIAEMAFLRANPALRLLGVAESKKSLEGRIRHMITRPIPKSASVGVTGVLLVAAIGAVLLPMAKAQRRQGGTVTEDGREDSQSARMRQERATSRGEHRVSALPLTDFQRGLIEQMLGLVKQVEQRYPDKAKHWPVGPGLYQVDGQGQITVWHYQRLWRRSDDCAEDEVGWGSSQSAHATGMYYLVDGTPLQSRWSERGNGMKDIRVKVGRVVGEGERVPLIHRHFLPEDRVLWSRDGRKRTLLADSYEQLPLRIIVRVDRPMRLDSWWGADIESDVQYLDDYDQLLVSAPPRHNPGPTLVTVESPTGMVPDERNARTAQHPSEVVADKVDSAKRLLDLGKAVLVYANDHDDQLPAGIENVREYLNRVEVEWLLANVVYLGKDLSAADYPGRAVAYDRTLLAEGKGTNVLYLDSHVDFENSQELERLGISSVRWDAALRTYEVNRRVADFPRAEEFSTPEAAYATINQIDRDNMMEQVKAKLGPPDEEEDRWLSYRDKYGLDFMFSPSGVLLEIRMNPGFRGRLTSGISLASSQADVFKAYGRPIEERKVDNLHRQNEHRVLFQRGDVSRIYYADEGLIFWFKGDRISQMVTVPKRPTTQKPARSN